MNPILRRVLLAYRPLYLRGLLLDGQSSLPRTPDPDGSAVLPEAAPRRSRQYRTLTKLKFRPFHRRIGP